MRRFSCMHTSRCFLVSQRQLSFTIRGSRLRVAAVAPGPVPTQRVSCAAALLPPSWALASGRAPPLVAQLCRPLGVRSCGASPATFPTFPMDHLLMAERSHYSPHYTVTQSSLQFSLQSRTLFCADHMAFWATLAAYEDGPLAPIAQPYRYGITSVQASRTTPYEAVRCTCTWGARAPCFDSCGDLRGSAAAAAAACMHRNGMGAAEAATTAAAGLHGRSGPAR